MPRQSVKERRLLRYRLTILNSLLAVVCVGGSWAGRIESALPRQDDNLRQLHLPFRSWAVTDVELTPRERQILEPDEVLIRDYRSVGGQQAELAIIGGHRKKTIHNPAFCMAGGGWDTLWLRGTTLHFPGRNVPSTVALMSREGKQILVTYFFTDGDFSTGSLLKFQGVQALKRLRGSSSPGALIRIVVPVRQDEMPARLLTADFAGATVPPVLASLRRARLEPTHGAAGTETVHK